jgi:hypothetical protein
MPGGGLAYRQTFTPAGMLADDRSAFVVRHRSKFRRPKQK